MRHGAHACTRVQTLAVGLPSLAEYVGDMAPFAGAEWISSGEEGSPGDGCAACQLGTP